MVEEWKARRKEWKKKRRKKGKREKVVLGKVLFVFCLTVCLRLPFFSLHPPHHHTTTPQHTLTLTHHPPYIMTHWRTPSNANRAVCCAAFLGVDNETHTASSTPHTPSLDITQHTSTNSTKTQLMVQATMRCQLSMRRGLDKGKKWDNTAAPTH